MDQPQLPLPRQPFIVLPDYLVHFKHDGPAVKLLALFICTLPRILALAGSLVLAVRYLPH